jgi:hypothetical protein
MFACYDVIMRQTVHREPHILVRLEPYILVRLDADTTQNPFVRLLKRVDDLAYRDLGYFQGTVKSPRF